MEHQVFHDVVSGGDRAGTVHDAGIQTHDRESAGRGLASDAVGGEFRAFVVVMRGAGGAGRVLVERAAVGGAQRDERRGVEHASVSRFRGVEHVAQSADIHAVENGAVLRPRLDQRGAMNDGIAACGRATEGAGVLQVPRRRLRGRGRVHPARGLANKTAHDLRPGMRGRATIEGDRRPLAWIIGHRFWDFVVESLFW